MIRNLNPARSLIAGIALGVLISLGIYLLLGDDSGDMQQNAAADKKPLYWVAPMDPNYRSDKPGKSPMGMDLIPVYSEEGGGVAGPGTIRISPEVINNLGVRTARVERKVMSAEIKTVGYVQYDEDHLVHVHPRVEGWVERLYIKASGDPVEKGQPLYEIYSPELVNAQEELVIALDRNNQRLIRAAEDRLKALQLPEKAIDELRQTKKVKQRITFYAPQSGVVDNLAIREGFFVKPGTSIMSIGTLNQVWVEAEVFERQASEVAVGQPVAMALDYLPGREWLGMVDYIYPTLDPKTRTVRIRLRFANSDEVLRPNMFAQIVIHPEYSDKTLIVPREGVIRTGNANRVVLALGDGRFKSVEVEIGRVDEQFAEILMGLKEGDRIVTSAQFLLDSESSKTSDFRRMSSADDEKTSTGSVWVQATVNSLMPEHRMINVTHKPIAEWNWPQMTMNFNVADSVDMARLITGMTLHIELSENGENQYEITAIHSPDQGGMKHGDIDHAAMDHSAMNHETMDHQGMNHEGMKGMDDASEEGDGVDSKTMDHTMPMNHGDQGE